MFKTYQIASLPLRLATFTNRCAKHSDADIKACGMWDTMFQQAVALATWDVDSTEWTVKNPEDFIDLEHDVRIVLIKFLDVNITPGLGEVLMVMDRQRLDAGEDILPDEDASEVRPHSPLHVVYNANKHRRVTRRATRWRAQRATRRTRWWTRRMRRWTRWTRREAQWAMRGRRRTRTRTSLSSPGWRTRDAIKTRTEAM